MQEINETNSSSEYYQTENSCYEERSPPKTEGVTKLGMLFTDEIVQKFRIPQIFTLKSVDTHQVIEQSRNRNNRVKNSLCTEDPSTYKVCPKVNIEMQVN